MTVRVTLVLGFRVSKKARIPEINSRKCLKWLGVKTTVSCPFDFAMLLFPIAGPKKIMNFGQEESCLLSIFASDVLKILDRAIRSSN